MKKSDRNLLLAAGAAGGVAWLIHKKKQNPTVSGMPGIGALLPSTGPLSAIIPKSLQGQPSPAWLDATVWGLLGAGLGYYGLAGKKF